MVALGFRTCVFNLSPPPNTTLLHMYVLLHRTNLATIHFHLSLPDFCVVVIRFTLHVTNSEVYCSYISLKSQLFFREKTFLI